MQGTIGDIIVYLDYYINDEVIALYYNSEEFVYQWDSQLVKDKGIEFQENSHNNCIDTFHYCYLYSFKFGWRIYSCSGRR